MPHGAGLAALLPGWMEWFALQGHASRVAALGHRIYGIATDMPADDAAADTIMFFSRWMKTIGCPTDLKGLFISMRDHRAIAENAMVQAGIWGIENEYRVKVIMDILERCQERDA